MTSWEAIGGILVAPRRTLDALLRDEQVGIGPLVVLIVVACAISVPIAVAQDALVAGLDVWRGATMTAQGIARYAIGRVGALAVLYSVAFSILWLRTGRPGAGRLTSLGVGIGYLYVPSFVLVLVGKGLAILGADVGWLPHLPVVGVDKASVIRLVVSFAWSAALLPLVIAATERAASAQGEGAATESGAKASTRRPGSRARSRIALGIVAAVSIALLGAAYGEVRDSYPAIRPIYPGDPAPEISLPSAADVRKRVVLTELRGKVVLVDFWATWCPPCVKSMPAVQALYSALRPQGFEVVTVNRDLTPDRLPRVRKFMSDHGLDMPVGMDSGQAASAYRLLRLPTTFLIDRSGIVRHVHIGAIDAGELEAEVRELLAEAPPIPVPES